MDLELIGERDYDVAARHAAQLVEGVMDGIGVLEYVERDDDVRFIIRQRDAVIEIREEVCRWMDVQAEVFDGMFFERLPERLIPAPGIEHCSPPDPRIRQHQAPHLLQRAPSTHWKNLNPLVIARYERHYFDGHRTTSPVEL